MTLLKRLKAWLSRGFLPAVLNDDELMVLTKLLPADLDALASDSDSQGLSAYRYDNRGNRQWHLRRCMPTACRVLRRLG